jgi:hypothetical protein
MIYNQMEMKTDGLKIRAGSGVMMIVPQWWM